MDVQEAALCLCQMKHTELDPKTAKDLRDIIQKTERRMFFETRSVPPKHILPASSQHLCLKINQTKVENKIQGDNKIENRSRNEKDVFEDQKKIENKIQEDYQENRSRNEKGVFEADPEFVRKLLNKSDEIDLTKLPMLGKAIDGITLPSLPPIESLKGQIISCSAPFEKQMTKSDLDKSQSRFAFCKEQVDCVLNKFMNEGEREKVLDPKGLIVTVYDRMGSAFEMKFVKWGKMHVLTRGWTEFVTENKLEVHLDWAALWMFRHRQTQRLCFGIVARRFPTVDLIGKIQKNGNKAKRQRMEE